MRSKLKNSVFQLFQRTHKTKIMTAITFKGNQVNTLGELPAVGEKAKDFTLVGTNLSDISLSDYAGKYVILNIFPSINTGVCAESVRKFNDEAAKLDNTVILGISKDLPFAQSQFCEAEDIDNIEMASDFRTSFGVDYGTRMQDGPLKGLLSRAVIVIDPEGQVIYREQVPEIGQEPNYQEALGSIKTNG
jgi:thiol peroxidase